MPVARAGCSLTRVCSPLPCRRFPVSQMAVGCGSGSHTLTSHSPTSELIVWVLNNSILMLHVGPRYFCFPSLLVWQPAPGGSPTPDIRALDRATLCMYEMNPMTRFQWVKSSKGDGCPFWDRTMIDYVFHLLHRFFLWCLSHASWDRASWRNSHDKKLRAASSPPPMKQDPYSNIPQNLILPTTTQVSLEAVLQLNLQMTS